MLFLALAVAVALVGGLAPAVSSAVLGVAILNYWFTPPLYTWKIAQTEHVLALVVFALVAAGVSSVVDLAARRGKQAARAQAEAETLSGLAASLLRGEDSVAAVLARLKETFGLRQVEVVEACEDGSWRRLGVSGDGEGPPSEQLPLSPTTVLRLDGGDVRPEDRRVLESFAAHTTVVLERERLRARAAETQRLEEGVAIRTALLAAVSHDLRTPLASIRAASSSLVLPGMVWTDADRTQMLGTIEESAGALQRLVDNLLDLSRLQAGVVQPLLQPVSLDEIVPQALDGVPPDAVRVDVPDDLPLLLTDAGLLERVIANVVQNAVRYSAEAPDLVVIAADASEDAVTVRVVDRGPGVPEAAKARMFEAFQRVGDVPAGSGVGLGLAVARGFASAVSAELEATGTPGGGLTMVLRVPRA